MTNYSKAIQNEITLNYQYLYDQYGNNTGIVYPSAMQINNIYDSYGNLTEIRQENGTLIWQLNSVRATGNPTQYTLGPNSLTRTFGYDTYEHLTGITTGLWQQSYLFDAPSGNLTSRSYKHLNSMDVLTEDFDYDSMNRLTSTQVDGLQQYSVTYGQGGNILTKSDAGVYTYDQTKINALISLENNPGTISPELQSLTYNSQNKPLLISEGAYSNSFLYGTDGQRFRSELSRNDTLIKTRYYAPGYEKTVTADSTWENYYIVSPYGLAALIVKQDSASRIFYAETDHLGSLIGLMNGDGTFAERFSYDAWGRRRNPADWSYSNVPGAVLTERGFTGHEHLDIFGLINMNGRIYDPVTARFLNADPVIQDPSDSEVFNAYSYCLNNPLKYIDPNGFKFAPPDNLWQRLRLPSDFRIVMSKIGDFFDSIFSGGGGSNDSGTTYDYSSANDVAIQNAYFNYASSPFESGSGDVNTSGHLQSGGSGGSSGMALTSYNSVVNAVNKKTVTTVNGTSLSGQNRITQKYRPDSDSYLTYLEAKYWYQFGQGQPLYLELNMIDFSKVHLSDFKNGQATVFLFSVHKANLFKGMVHGRLLMELMPGTYNVAQVVYKEEVNGRGEMYNFEWISGAGLSRNMGTIAWRLSKCIREFYPYFLYSDTNFPGDPIPHILPWCNYNQPIT